MSDDTSNVLIDHFWVERGTIRDVVWVIGFSLLTAVMAQIRIALPFTPVPITGQTFAVLLSGAVLGSRRAMLSQAIYLAEGAAGLPVFAGGTAWLAHLAGTAGGYLWSYPLAAGLLGWLVERGASRKTWRLAAALVLCDALILACGSLWLRFILGISFRTAWVWGFNPFLIGDICKIVLVGLSLPRILKRYQAPEA